MNKDEKARTQQGPNTSPKVEAKENLFTTDEKAQYEVFKNGNLPRDTIQRWIENDLGAIISFAHGILKDERVKKTLVDAYYERYTALHANAKDNEPVQNK